MKTNAMIVSLILLAGCATSPDYDAHFGDAVRDARLQMTIHPQPAADDESVIGLDGRAAQEAMQRYHDSFKAPPPVTNVINVGGVGRSAGTQ